MEAKQDPKNVKQKHAVASTVALRVKRETRKKILIELSKANKKDFGRNLRAEDLVALAITLIRPEHIAHLQTMTLTNADRLEQQYRTYIAQHGSISKDAFLGKLLGGELTQCAGPSNDALQKV